MITTFKLSPSRKCPSKKDDQIVIDLSTYSQDICDLLMQESKRQCEQNPGQEKLTITFDGTQKDLSEDIYLVLLYEQNFCSPVWDYFKYVKRIPNKYSTKKDWDRKDSHFIPD